MELSKSVPHSEIGKYVQRKEYNDEIEDTQKEDGNTIEKEEEIDNFDINEAEISDLLSDIRSKYKICTNKNIRAEIKAVLADNGGKLSEDIPVDILKEIQLKLG